MRGRAFLPVVFLAALPICAVALGGDQTPQTGTQPPDGKQKPQAPTFSVGIEVVSLNVTVTDGTNRYVTDLDEAMFSIFEDGVMQDVSYFNRSNQPIALALLLDTSASMEDKLATAQEAAVGFARRLRTADVAEVIDFDSRVEIVQPFTNDSLALERAIQQTAAGGSTALYNAIYISLKELKKIQARNVDEVRRQAIIVLSDGEDTSSLVSFEEVLELAKRSETAIYAIGLRGRDQSDCAGIPRGGVRPQTAHGGNRRPGVLSDGRRGAGLPSTDRLPRSCRASTSLGYTSKNGRRDGAWRRIVVRVNRPNARPRTKQGYYAPTTH